MKQIIKIFKKYNKKTIYYLKVHKFIIKQRTRVPFHFPYN